MICLDGPMEGERFVLDGFVGRFLILPALESCNNLGCLHAVTHEYLPTGEWHRSYTYMNWPLDEEIEAPFPEPREFW